MLVTFWVMGTKHEEIRQIVAEFSSGPVVEVGRYRTVIGFKAEMVNSTRAADFLRFAYASKSIISVTFDRLI